VYYIHTDGEPRYLLMKRYAVSKRIERVAPKGKIEPGETIEQAAIREISEEAGIPTHKMRLGIQLGVTHLRSDESSRGQLNKDTTYFLVEYLGDPLQVTVEDGGGLTGMYKWATLADVLSLLYYQDIRELVRKAHHAIKHKRKNNDVKSAFIKTLD
jgi:8-oxo-dGTP pyrophosphatase MutT (NUDIX family)